VFKEMQRIETFLCVQGVAQVSDIAAEWRGCCQVARLLKDGEVAARWRCCSRMEVLLQK
jgi:hypothetical protein